MTGTKLIFCSNEQTETEHILSVDKAGEIVATCGCGFFLKFPAGMTKEQFQESLTDHKEQNSGQVKQADVEKELQKSYDFLQEVSDTPIVKDEPQAVDESTPNAE